MVSPPETGKSQSIYECLKNGSFQANLLKLYFFDQHSQPLYGVTQREIDNLGFVQGLNFESLDSLKNNGTEKLLIFDTSCKETCTGKTIVDIATAGSHRGLIAIYIKHNLFH